MDESQSIYPPHRVHIKVLVKQPLNCKMVDAWLFDLLEMDKKDAWFISQITSENCVDIVRQWLDRYMFLTLGLFHAAKIPIIGKPMIRALQKVSQNDGTAVDAVIDFPILDGLEKNIYNYCSYHAFHFLEWINSNYPTPSNQQKLYEQINKTIVVAMKNIMPPGKSRMAVLLEANRQNIPFVHLVNGIIQIGWGAKACRMDRSTTEKDSAIGLYLSENKHLTTKLLRQVGLPTPKHAVVFTTDQCNDKAKNMSLPLVIKPIDGNRGEGVTIGLSDMRSIVSAFNKAKKYSKHGGVLIEQQVPGVCHRLFIARNELLYAVKRLPIGIYGDGNSSVQQLAEKARDIEIKRPEWLREPFPMIDELALETMQNNGLTPEYIPQNGEFVSLRPIETTSWGGIDENVTHKVHPENIDIAIRAARHLSLDMAGIDLISTDISQPWYENMAVINEINYAPLLGGGEVSRNSLSVAIQRLVNGNGRIPVHIYLGADNASELAIRAFEMLASLDVKVFFAREDIILTSLKQEVHVNISSFFERIRAILLDQRCEFLVIAIRTTELLYSGIPFDAFDELFVVDNKLMDYHEAKYASQAQFKTLCAHLESICANQPFETPFYLFN